MKKFGMGSGFSETKSVLRVGSVVNTIEKVTIFFFEATLNTFDFGNIINIMWRPNMLLYSNSWPTYVVNASTKSSELRNEKPLNIKNDRLNALEVHLSI